MCKYLSAYIYIVGWALMIYYPWKVYTDIVEFICVVDEAYK
jgi:hypothetical protein